MFPPEHEAGLRPVRRSDSSLVERQEVGAGPGAGTILDRFKRLLRVDSDEDTDNLHTKYKVLTLEYRLYGVIQDVAFTYQPYFSCSFLSLICLSTNQNVQPPATLELTPGPTGLTYISHKQPEGNQKLALTRQPMFQC